MVRRLTYTNADGFNRNGINDGMILIDNDGGSYTRGGGGRVFDNSKM